MRIGTWVLTALLVVGSPLFGTTFYGGLEDWNNPASDYDYNDLVFSLSGPGLTLHTLTGAWFNQPALSSLNTGTGSQLASATPFWNNPSLDGAGGYNIGFCLYGGGACNGGIGLAPGDQYLATATGGVVNDVYFSAIGSVIGQVYLSNTIAADSIGWQLLSGGPVTWFASGVQGPVMFSPGGDFILVAQNATIGSTFASNAALADGSSHFAFFGSAAPEPAALGFLGIGLVGMALRRVHGRQKL